MKSNCIYYNYYYKLIYIFWLNIRVHTLFQGKCSRTVHTNLPPNKQNVCVWQKQNMCTYRNTRQWELENMCKHRSALVAQSDMHKSNKRAQGTKNKCVFTHFVSINFQNFILCVPEHLFSLGFIYFKTNKC